MDLITRPRIGGPLVGSTQNSILYAGLNGVFAQNNTAFSWDDTNRRLIIQGLLSQLLAYQEWRDSTGTPFFAVSADKTLLIPDAAVNGNNRSTTFRSTTNQFGNVQLRIERTGANSYQNGCGLFFLDNANEASIRWMNNYVTQNTADLEFWTGGYLVYSCASTGGNNYYNNHLFVSDVSALRVPAQIFAPNGSSALQSAFQIVQPQQGSGPTVTTTDFASIYIEGPIPINHNGGFSAITNPHAILVNTKSDNAIGITVRANSATQNRALQEWQSSASATLASVSGKGNLKVQGFGAKVVTKTSTYTAADERVILCDATGGAFTINLPAAAGAVDREYVVKKIDASANAITIDGSGTETIDGALTQSLAARWQSLTIVSDGSNWFII